MVGSAPDAFSYARVDVTDGPAVASIENAPRRDATVKTVNESSSIPIAASLDVDVVVSAYTNTLVAWYDLPWWKPFVIAGAGAKVAKHGNRSNRRAGSADVLEALGARLQTTPDQAADCIEEVGLAFLFAPSYHPAMRYAIGPRRELKERTVFNILGPLTNPAGPTNMLVGVFAPELTETMASVLGQMGRRAAYVVHGYYEPGAGLDELTTTGPSRISHLKDGEINTFEFEPGECVLL